MVLMRMLARRAAVPQLMQNQAPYNPQLVLALRTFSTNVTPPSGDAPVTPVQQEKKAKTEEPLTNKKLWDKVLTNHPEQNDRTNGDLLYEYSRKSYFGILSAGSLAHIAFWSWFKGYEQSLVEMLPQVNAEPNFISFVTNDMGSSIGFGSSILLAFLIGFHAKRSVARISVVSGGDKLRITTHKFFGNLGEPFDVPVAHVSANPNMKKNMILKVGKDHGFYLVDIDGEFYNRKKLESMITFRTDFSAHDDMIKAKDKAKTIEIRTDLPRTELKQSENQSKASPLPKRVPFHQVANKNKTKGNLLGRKPSNHNKPKGKK